MTIIYRTEKGTPLSSDEIDNNFRELNLRLKALEDHPESAEGLGKIQVKSDQITFTGTFGTNFGTFTLPKGIFNLCGYWTSQKPYQKLDMVTYESALYSCLKEHTSTLWSQDHIFWQEILAIPHPPSSTLSLYEKETLPEKESLGKLAILMEEGGVNLIYFNGNTWQRLMKGDPL